MLLEQKERIIKIIEGINLPANVALQGLQYPPDSLENIQLPACLPLPQNIAYNRDGAQGFLVACTWNLYLFIRQVGTGNEAQAFVEPMALLDEFANTFLTRPQLQHNGQVLTGLVGNLSLSSPQNLATPLTYPIRASQGMQYWGATFNLTITQRQTYAINISGA